MLLNAPDIATTQGQRGCGRCPGGFTPAATAAARRHANTPEVLVFACDIIRMSAIRKLAVPAPDNRLPAPELGRRHRVREERAARVAAKPTAPTLDVHLRARGRTQLPTHHDQAACTMARMLASGAVAGMAQPAFRMKRRVSPNRTMSSRDLASTSAGVPSATTELVVEVADEDGGVLHEVVSEADVGLVVQLKGIGAGGDQVGDDRLGIAADMHCVPGSPVAPPAHDKPSYTAPSLPQFGHLQPAPSLATRHPQSGHDHAPW